MRPRPATQRSFDDLRSWLLALSSASLLCAACEDRRASARDAGLTEPSPNASILPAPLANGIEAPGASKKLGGDDPDHRDAGRLAPSDAASDAGPPEPHYLRQDQGLFADAPRETSGLSLSARLRWLDLPAPPRVPEQNAEGLQRARDAAAFDVGIDLAASHLRLTIASRAFTLPSGSELHARDDLYGAALLWPGRTTYTVIAPGALRSVLSQGRADVVPLVRARFSALARGTFLALATERAELSTPTGRLELEQARGGSSANATWASGVSLCHLLLELLGALPTSPACHPDLVPVRAEYTWPNGEHFVFEVVHLQRRGDLNPGAFAMPAAGGEFRQSELPEPPPSTLLSDNELADLRLRPTARTERLDSSAPKRGLLLVNHGESLRYFSVDGALAARLAPGAEQLLLGLRGGKYQISARDFFSGEDMQTRIVEVPARFTVGDDTEKAH